MKLLALDQASKTSGYSIWEDGKLLDYGTFTFSDGDLGKRLVKIRDKVEQLVIENDISEVIMEDIQFQKNIGDNVKTLKILAEVFGVIYESMTRMKKPVSAVLAVTWKSEVGIKGTRRPEQKENARKYVLKTYDVAASTDEADAICIGEYYFSKQSKEKPGYDWS